MNKLSSKTSLTGFAELLANQNLATESQLTQALTQATSDHSTLIHCLLQHKTIPSAKLAETIAHFYKLPLVDLSSYDVTRVPKQLLNGEIVQKRQGLPLRVDDNQLQIAVADPTLPILNEVKFHTGLNPRIMIADAAQLSQAIDNVLNEQLAASYSSLSEEELASLADQQEEALPAELIDSNQAAEEAPIVRFVSKLLLQAIHKRASDIHFEPYENIYRIRFRQDGVLREIAKPSTKIINQVVARLKIMANLDISERRLPQDGRFRVTFSENRPVDFRMSTCPTLYGEKVVLRLLDHLSSLPAINDLGMTDKQRTAFNDAIKKLQGMVLVTGPTGSGKTTTLYAALNEINTLDKNICTVEDPVEINLPGINQVPVNIKTGLTFSKALRAFLRQDPDIIMVGEIRDLETAEVAVRAAQTGHLVFSTLHTNNAAETLVRLANMGIPSYNIASSISLIVAQRLARKLCDHCKKLLDVPKGALIEAGFDVKEVNQITIYAPGTCSQCNNGYQGRIAFFEVMPISKTLAQLIMSGAHALQIAEQAQKEGIANLRQAGLAKVTAGLTSLEEINRMTVE